MQPPGGAGLLLSRHLLQPCQHCSKVLCSSLAGSSKTSGQHCNRQQGVRRVVLLLLLLLLEDATSM